MSGFFLTIVNMSISASWLVLAVLLLRLLLKKTPKWISVLLWGIVAIRLICPFTIESVMSLIPSAETISPEIMMDRTPEINFGVPIINNVVNPVIGEAFAPGPTASANPLQIWIPIFSLVWIVGITGMLIYTIISYFRVKGKIGTAVLLRDNIFQSESVVSPFVLGIIRPKIYLPFNMNGQNMTHVIAHEQAHIRRKDHLWKPLGFLVLALHWFNPLMWLGYVLLCRDIELACDEKVIKELNSEQRADYSQALLTCSVNRRMIAACPLAFGEVGVKNRVKSVLSYKKPAFWIILIAIVASIVVAVCFLTNPSSNTLENIEFLNFESSRQNTVSVLVSDGETYTPVGAVNQDLLNELCSIKISKNEVSRSRSEDRDKSHTLVLQTAKNVEPTIYSYVEGWHIHFNSTFTSVWVNNGVKPTLSYRVINPQKAKQIYEDIANFAGAEKLTWTYQPMLSFTGHSFKGFLFDFDYTHVEASCTGGEFCSLDVDGQPYGEKMRFENENTVYWTPKEAVIEKIPQKSEVTLEIYNDETQVHKCTIVFECVSRDTASAEFEIYLKVPGGLQMVSSDGRIKLVKQSSISNVGGADGPNNVIVGTTLDQLKVKYPQFFNVSTDGGLTVYIWQMAVSDYSCFLVNTSMEAISDNSFAYGVGASIAELRLILTTYEIDQKDITIQPVRNPLSSYYYVIDDAYRTKIKELFWNTTALADSLVIDAASFDIDGDGKEEQCALSAGPTSGSFTFVFSVSENGNLEYFNIFNSPSMELHFEKNAEGVMMLIGKTGEQIRYMGMDVSDGNIVISSDEQNISYWGEQGLNSPYAPKTASNLNNAIVKVLNEKYRAEKPDGLIHIENYYLLANEVVSGTPIVGNSGHMEKATVYLLVYHMKYSVNGQRVEEREGDFVPTVITFAISEKGEYTLEEYWTPRTSANYEKDVRSKFPGASADDALNIEKYAEGLIKENWRQATEYLNKITNAS